MPRRLRGTTKPVNIPQEILDNPAYSSLAGLLQDSFLSPTELADRWCISNGHLGNQRRLAKRMPFITLGPRKYLYRLSEVRELEANSHFPTREEICREVDQVLGIPTSVKEKMKRFILNGHYECSN